MKAFHRYTLPFSVTFALVLAACGGGGAASPPATGGGQPAGTDAGSGAACEGVETLSFTHTMNDQESPLMEEIATGFEGTEVDVTQIPFEGAQQAYDQQAAGGEAPDVFRAEIAWTADYADKGYLLDITDMVSEDELSDYLEGPLNYNRWQGRLYGLPQVTDALALLYNKRLFEEADVEVPETMEDFVAAGEQIQESTDVESAFYMRGDAYWLQPYLWAFGGGLFTVDEEGNVTEILVNNEGSVAGLEFLLNDVLGTIAPEDVDFANDYGNAMTGFKDGDVAMIFNGPWSTADVLSGAEFQDPENLGVAVIPAGPDGSRGSPIGGHNYVAYAGMDEAKQACAVEFIRYLNEPENQAQLATELNLLPTRASTYELPEVQENRLIAEFQTVIENDTNRPVVPEGGAIYTDFRPNFQTAWTGDKTAQQALDDTAAAWEELLAARMGQ